MHLHLVFQDLKALSIQVKNIYYFTTSKIKFHETKAKQSCFDIWIEESCIDKSDLKLSLYGSSIDGTYKFNDTKYSGLNAKNFIRFIETDKPVYKPGDKCKNIY